MLLISISPPESDGSGPWPPSQLFLACVRLVQSSEHLDQKMVCLINLDLGELDSRSHADRCIQGNVGLLHLGLELVKLRLALLVEPNLCGAAITTSLFTQN